MEFLIGCSLASNVSNLLLDPAMLEACREKNVDWYELLDQEPDAGLGNGGLGTIGCVFRGVDGNYGFAGDEQGLRYEFGIFKQAIENGWQNEQPDNWLRRPDPWEVVRLDHIVEVKLSMLIPDSRRPSGSSSRASLLRCWASPSTAPCVGYGGLTINTLRLWRRAAPDSFSFPPVQSWAISWAR